MSKTEELISATTKLKLPFIERVKFLLGWSVTIKSVVRYDIIEGSAKTDTFVTVPSVFPRKRLGLVEIEKKDGSDG